ncbi:MAG: hypothetical protein ABH986_02675 [archaeon]
MFDRNELKRLTENQAKKDFFSAGHINRCFDCLELIKENSFDEETVFAGILLHSIGFSQSVKFNQDLIQTSLNLAKKFLVASGFPKEKTDFVLHCIQEAGLKGQPKTIEAILVHEVNLLDEISAVGIVKDSVLFYLKKISLKSFLEEEKTKAFLLKTAFFTEKAKILAEKRMVLLDSFVESLETELK